ncbi:hypothetical protein ACOMHN_033593 [Nucella lapillus]
MSGSLTIVSRSEWKARSPKKVAEKMKQAAKHVLVHHSAGPFAADRASCIQQVQSFQKMHMDDNKWDDIGYSFVVGEDGNAYEGRGWNRVGAHTTGYNAVGIGICVIGNYNIREPNAAALGAVRQLIDYGVRQGHISSDYTLRGHRDVGATECPGEKLYAHIKSCPKYQ